MLSQIYIFSQITSLVHSQVQPVSLIRGLLSKSNSNSETPFYVFVILNEDFKLHLLIFRLIVTQGTLVTF